MNLAYYLVVFDLATDALWPALGLGPGLRSQGRGTFAVETWIGYARKVTEGAPLVCDSTVLAHDTKRLLVRHRMRHATEGWLVAENEVLFLCVDLAARRVTHWPAALPTLFAAACVADPPKRLALTQAG